MKYNLKFWCNITIQYKSYNIYVRDPHAAREPQFAHGWNRLSV